MKPNKKLFYILILLVFVTTVVFLRQFLLLHDLAEESHRVLQPNKSEPNLIVVVNSGNKDIRELQITFKSIDVHFFNIKGNYGKQVMNVSDDMSGEFKFCATITYEDGSSFNYEENMIRPKGRPVLQIGIKDNGKVSFR